MKLGWYSELNPIERRTYWACFAGFGLDSMDSTIYALVIPALIAPLVSRGEKQATLRLPRLRERQSAAGAPVFWPIASDESGSFS
jgi:hypothetical protein